MKNSKQKKTTKGLLKGTVVSDKMDKTVVVLVERLKQHSLYKKRYKVHKKYKVHDPENKYKIGDKVKIRGCKPISKDKKWVVIEGLKKSKVQSQKSLPAGR